MVTSMQAVHRLSLGVTCALLKVNSFFPLFSLTACRTGCLSVSAQAEGERNSRARLLALSRDSQG